jgi:hypothetical protein
MLGFAPPSATISLEPLSSAGLDDWVKTTARLVVVRFRTRETLELLKTA